MGTAAALPDAVGNTPVEAEEEIYLHLSPSSVVFAWYVQQ